MLQKDKPVADVSVMVARIEEQAATIERQKLEISALESKIDEMEKKWQQTLDLADKEVELQQRAAAAEAEVEKWKKAVNNLEKPLKEHIKGLEDIANIDVSVFTQNFGAANANISRFLELQEEREKKSGWTLKDTGIALLICAVVAGFFYGFAYVGAKKGGINDVYEKVEAVGGRVQNVQQRLKDNGFLTNQERQQQEQ